MKTRSNQKVEENNPALKFNFAQEFMHPDMILRIQHSHRALAIMQTHGYALKHASVTNLDFRIVACHTTVNIYFLK